MTVPNAWIVPAGLDELSRQFGELPVLRRSEAARDVALGILQPDFNWQWLARNFTAAGNCLVLLEPLKPPPQGITAMLGGIAARLREAATWHIPLTPTVHLLGTTQAVRVILNDCAQELQLEYGSVTVVDLMSGRALTWDAREGVTVEIEPARPGGPGDEADPAPAT